MMRSAVVCAVALAAMCWTASAAGRWHKTFLGRDFTVDIPAAVGDDFLPSQDFIDKGMLMDFTETSKSSGSLRCYLVRTRYDAQLKRAAVAESFKDDTRNNQCSPPSGVSGYAVLLSQQGRSNLYPAGRCVAAMTDQDGGLVLASLGIAAPDGYFLLDCAIHAPDRDSAVRAWQTHWNGEISHVQASLHLPRRN